MQKHCLIVLIMLLFTSASSIASPNNSHAKRIVDIPKFVDASGKRRAVQAMDMYNGLVFVGFDGGYCRTIDIRTKKVVGEFPLGSNVPSNHCGNLNFGLETPEGSKFPALYVSGDLTTFSCYVEKVTPTSAELIQTIKFNLQNGYNSSQVIIDRDRRCIWYMQRKERKINVAENTIVIFRFRLPALSEGDVTFTEADIEQSYCLPVWLRLYQGACIRKGLLYEVSGIVRSDSPTAKLSVFDISNGQLLSVTDLSFIDREPQGVTFYKGRMYINFQDALWRF